MKRLSVVLAVAVFMSGCQWARQVWESIPAPVPVTNAPPIPVPTNPPPVVDPPKPPPGGVAETWDIPSNAARVALSVKGECALAVWDVAPDARVEARVRWTRAGGWLPVAFSGGETAPPADSILTPRCSILPSGAWIAAQAFKSGDLLVSGTRLWHIEPGSRRAVYVGKIDVPCTGWNRSEVFSAGEACLLLGNNGGSVTVRLGTSGVIVTPATQCPIGVSAEQHGFGVSPNTVAGCQAGGPGNPPTFGYVVNGKAVGPLRWVEGVAVSVGDDFTHPACAVSAKMMWMACSWPEGLYVDACDLETGKRVRPVRVARATPMSRQPPPLCTPGGTDVYVGYKDGTWKAQKMRVMSRVEVVDLRSNAAYLAMAWDSNALYFVGSGEGKVSWGSVKAPVKPDDCLMLSPDDKARLDRAGDVAQALIRDGVDPNRALRSALRSM